MSEMMTEAALRWAERNRAATRDEVVAMAAECLRLRARVAELEAERDDHGEAYREGAESMRERAAAHVDAEGDAHKEQARQWRNPAICASHDATMIVCYRLADEIRALPLDESVRAANGGDHA